MDHRWIVVIATFAVMRLAACSQSAAEEDGGSTPATIEHVDGTDVARLTLTARAAQRLDIQTAPIETRGSRTAAPSAAVLYDPTGGTWVYTTPEPLVFVRHAVGVAYIDGELAVLTEGPPAGTEVVAVGVAELYGTEFEVGH